MEKLPEAKVVIGFACNNNCSFCYAKENRHIPSKNTNVIKKELEAIFKHGYERVHLIGGEPTVRKDIVEIISFARQLGFKDVMITTNGRMFSYADFTKKILDAGLTQIAVSLHGHNADVHDSLTQVSGSFNQVIEGIQQLQKNGFERIGINTVITAKNYEFLPELAKLAITLGIGQLEFIYVSVTDKKDSHMVPPIDLVIGYIEKAVKIGQQQKGYTWNVNNVPMMCYFDRIQSQSGCDGENEDDFILERSAVYHNVERSEKIRWKKLPQCQQCSLDGVCKGVQANYLQIYGDVHVKPVISK